MPDEYKNFGGSLVLDFGQWYEFDVRLISTPMYGGWICHVLLTVQNTHRRALLFIESRHFIGFLHKQN